ncbi:MAG: methionine biosynthesis protein MetW [Spirochaetia bacterium]|nr:methionine biosynthesis protein MetW [Spirochaetia bacterium]
MSPFVYDKAIEWIPDGARVLDLGTGDGAFLERLNRARRVSVEGVEKDPEMVARCIERGLVVHQGDILDGLDQYAARSFDYVLMLGTFQELLSPGEVLSEAFRVGRRVMIAYTNFAYWRSRVQLMFTGRTPRTASMPYRWYETPNVHFFSISDFHEFCGAVRMKEINSAYFSKGGPVRSLENLRAEQAMSLLTYNAPHESAEI